MNIISTKQMQQKIGEISANIEENGYIITKHGKGKMVILPYFDGCDEWIENYIEDYEMMKNKDKLQKELRASLDSGIGKLKI